MSRRTLVFITLIAVAALAFATGTRASDGGVDEKAPRPIAGPGPLWIPAEEPHVSLKPGVKLDAPDGRPLAQLDEPGTAFVATAAAIPSDLRYVEERTYASVEEAKSIEMLGSIRYKNGAHTVVVTTARPGPEAYKPGWPLGDREIQLPDGTAAWATYRLEVTPETPNAIVFERDGFLVTVLSDLPDEALKGVAARVLMSR